MLFHTGCIYTPRNLFYFVPESGVPRFKTNESISPSVQNFFFMLRLFLMATWKSGLGNDIYYIHRSVKPVKWPVADGGEEKVAFLREFF